jgi:DNA polymerase
MDKEKSMYFLKEEIFSCEKCPLFQTKINFVVGEGSLNPKIMFIGEAPGSNEDKQGKPFVGRAGKILDELLNSIGIKREEVYIANILKCRPPQNRNPNSEEISFCSQYLNKQIEIINPKIICCLGNFAKDFIMKKFGLEKEIKGISEIHGKIFNINTLSGKIKIMPLYHPAVATYKPSTIEILKKDFEIVKKNL